MRGAMKVLNFADEDEENIFKIMAIVLHLGNIEFGGKKVIIHQKQWQQKLLELLNSLAVHWFDYSESLHTT